MSQNLDFPIWTHSGESGPLHHNITIQPKSAIPGSTWNVQGKVDAPFGWMLRKASLTNNPSTSNLTPEGLSIASKGSLWTFQMEYQGDMPPFGPGPQLETLWETPDGPVSILIDSGLTLTGTLETSKLLQHPKPFPLAAPVLVALVLVLVGTVIWISMRPKFRMRRWAHRTWAKQPKRDSSWAVWETWLNNAAHSARTSLPDVARGREWISILDDARFGPPFNETWKQLVEGLPE
jgi:hypothetical protein